MELDKVEAFTTSDGKVFPIDQKENAIAHQKEVYAYAEMEKLIESGKIQEWISRHYELPNCLLQHGFLRAFVASVLLAKSDVDAEGVEEVQEELSVADISEIMDSGTSEVALNIGEVYQPDEVAEMIAQRPMPKHESTFEQNDTVQYMEAIQVVRNANRVSGNLLRDALKIGDGKARRFMDKMENDGIISAKDDKGLRKVIPVA